MRVRYNWVAVTNGTLALHWKEAVKGLDRSWWIGMRRLTWIGLMLFLGGCAHQSPARSSAGHETTLPKIQEPSVTILRADGYEVQIEVKEIVTEPVLSGYWGVATDKSLIIAKARLFYQGEEFRFPRSAYADLANMREPSLATTATGCKLKLRGGDASEAYTCILTFKDGNLAKRVVRWNIKPESDYEVTEYHQSNDPFEMD